MWLRIIVFTVVVVIVLIVGYSIYQLYPSEPAPIPQEEELQKPEEEIDQSYTDNEFDKIDLIRIENPKPNQTINSPLTIKNIKT